MLPNRFFARFTQPYAVAAGSLFFAILVAGIALRLHFSAFLDPFEDGFQNWWISSNLLTTGQYWDRHSMMTQGNWLPLYHFFGTAVLWIGGWHDFEVMKLANIALSTLTAILVFQVGKRQGLSIGLAAMAFFSLNFIDVVVSGWSTAESLATFLVFLGYAAYFRFNASNTRNRWIAAAAFGLAVMTRYEAWLAVGLVLLYGLVRRKDTSSRRDILWVLAPAMAFMVGYSLYALQWGFLPSIVINQTSTDVRYQIAVGTQRSAVQLLSTWWSGYLWYFPLVLVIGAAYAVHQIKRDVGSWIIAALWIFILGYTVLQYGNPSYRYVMISVPFLSLFAAEALGKGMRWSLPTHFPKMSARKHAFAVTFAVGTMLVATTMLPAAATFWDPGFVASRYMEPLKRAGEFLAAIPLPSGRILISESPIAAYYSGYPPDRILGSRWLPDDRPDALAFMKQNAAYLVYMGVPYYKLRTLFPELQNGTSTPDFELLFDAAGPHVGTHAIYVFGVVT